MNRYASHYLQIAPDTFLRQQVVEVVEGRVVRHFPLTTEVEDVVWMPGVIALEREEECPSKSPADHPDDATAGLPDDATADLPDDATVGLTPYIYYPFDFTAMRPVAATRRRRLP